MCKSPRQRDQSALGVGGDWYSGTPTARFPGVQGRGQEGLALAWGRSRRRGPLLRCAELLAGSFGADPGHPRGAVPSLICALDTRKGKRVAGRAAGARRTGAERAAGWRRRGASRGELSVPAELFPSVLRVSYPLRVGSLGAGGLWAREGRRRDRIHPTGCRSDLCPGSPSVAGGAVPEKGRVSAALPSPARHSCDCQTGSRLGSQTRPVVRRQSSFLLGNLSSSPSPGAGPKAPLWTAKARWIFPATASPLCGGDGPPLLSNCSAGASQGHNPTRAPAVC